VAKGVIQLPFLREPRRGDVIRGDVRIPDGPPPRTAIVVVHGFKGFKDWGFFPWLCHRLVAAGHAVVSFNFSRNGIGPDLESFSELDRFATNTLSLEMEELRSILGEVIEGDLLPRRPRSIGLMGHSRGGAQSVLVASEESRVAALVTWAAVSHFDRWTQETKVLWREEGRIWILNQRTGEQMPLDLTLLTDFEANRAQLDVPSAAARVRAPWLILHGEEDLTVWPGEATTLAAAAKTSRLHLIPAAGHTFGVGHPFAGPSPQLVDAVERTVAHFDRHLEQ
jgi:pimeloyl-ACP methyl ester carboxylesterase